MPGRAKVIFEGDAAKAISQVGKLQDKVDNLTRQLKTTGRQSGKTGRSVVDGAKVAGGATDEWKGKVLAVAAGYLSIRGGVNLVTAALRDMEAERKRGAEAIKRSEMGMASLAQLAGGDPEKLKHMISEAKASAKQGGMGLTEGAKLQFTLESLGVAKHRELFAQLYGVVGEPAALAEGAKTLQTAMGKGETGSIRQVLNKLLKASAVSKTTVEAFAPAATIGAKGMAAIGVSDEEYLAALAKVSEGLKSVDEAGTQLQAFAEVVIKKGVGGKGLVGRAMEIEKMDLSPEKLLKFFGRKEAWKGFQSIIAQQGEIGDVTAALQRVDTETGGKGDYVGRMLESYGGIPELKEAKKLRQKSQELEVEEQKQFGVGQLRREGVLTNIRLQSLREGEGGFTRTARSWMGETAGFLGASGETIEDYLTPMPWSKMKLMEEETRKIRQRAEGLSPEQRAGIQLRGMQAQQRIGARTDLTLDEKFERMIEELRNINKNLGQNREEIRSARLSQGAGPSPHGE